MNNKSDERAAAGATLRKRDPKHTPGPWHVALPLGLPRVDSKARIIADLHIAEGIGALQHGKNPGLRAEIAANARLIAAAPDLLEALKGALQLLEVDGSRHNIWHRAIDKAEGR